MPLAPTTTAPGPEECTVLGLRSGRWWKRRRALLAAAAAVLVAGLAAPESPVAAPAARAQSSCTGWASEVVPPTSIRVLRTDGPASGSVQAVPFHDYVTVVMAAEWGSGNPAQALQAGAVAVKEYAWYFAMNWRGGTATDGSCYDVVDSTRDQVYAPETHAPAPSIVSAVDASWGVTVLKSGHLFATQYNGGADVACGANADGWHLYQNSAVHCAQDGMLAAAILATYYSNATIMGGTAQPVGLRFTAVPSGGTAGAVLPVQPVVAIVDSTGTTVTSGPVSTAVVTLALAANAEGAALACAGGLAVPAAAGVATFTGCSVSRPGGDLALTASLAGLPDVAVPLTIAPAAPSLALSTATLTITWAQAVQFRAMLTPPAATATAMGRRLELQSSPDGAAWATVASGDTGADGTATLSWRPTTNAWYRATFAGSPDLGPATSDARRIVVRQVALLRPDSHGAVRAAARGTVVTFTTTVRPARPGLPPGRILYEIDLLEGGRWSVLTTRTATADAGGLAALRLVLSRPGSWRVRAMAVPTALNANSVWSPWEVYAVR